ncbi:MAG: hypothetical protein LC118_14895 [Dehalococcoidia bacterium]|nr:hypothetical protein [Dehalococcoidia bacterium]
MVLKAPFIAATAAGLVVLAGAVGGGIVMAQGSPAAGPGQGAPTAPAKGPDHQRRMDDFLQKLAANLGIDTAKLEDALKKTAVDEIDQALKDGKITQDQHDRMKSAIESGTLPFPGPGAWAGDGRGGKPGGFAELGPLFMGAKGAIGDFATWLGIDTATLQKDLAGGKTLAQEAQDHNKSRDELKSYLTDSLDAHLKQLVADGVLKQEKADALEKNVTDNLDKIIDGQRPAIGLPGNGGPFGGGRKGHGMMPNKSNSQTSPAPSGGASGASRTVPSIVS